MAQAHVALHWEQAEAQGCPSSTELTSAVESRLHREVFGPTTEDAFQLFGTWSEGPAGNELRLELRDPRGRSLGTRALHISGPCSDLAESLPLVVSLLVEQHRQHIALFIQPSSEPTSTKASPHAPETEPPAPAHVPSPTDAERASPHAPETEPPTPPPTPTRWRYSFTFGGSLHAFDAPWPTWGLFQLLRFGLEHLPFDFAAEGSLNLPRSVEHQGARADIWGFRAGAGLCPRLFETDRMSSLTCATLLVGRQYAQGRSFSVNRSGAATTVHLSARTGAELRFGSVAALGMALRTDLALLRSDLVAGARDSEQTIFASSALGVGVDIWLTLSFRQPWEERRVGHMSGHGPDHSDISFAPMGTRTPPGAPPVAGPEREHRKQHDVRRVLRGTRRLRLPDHAIPRCS